MAQCTKAARLSHGIWRLDKGPPAGSDAKPRATLRTSAGAGIRASGGCRAPARALPAYARVGHALRGDAARNRLELLGAREGYLDDFRLGEAGEARGMFMDGNVHGRQCAAPARARRHGSADRPRVP